jgi:hypothetical protein
LIRLDRKLKPKLKPETENMTTVFSCTEPSAATFKRDGWPVHKLISEIDPNSHKFYVGQAQTWLNAFQIFRELENCIGLPEAKEDRYAYFILLSALTTIGNHLLLKLKECSLEAVLFNSTKVSFEAFEGCVNLLEDSMKFFQKNLSSEEIQAIKSKIFEPNASAAA